jgi:hypothetical protein
MIGDGYNPRVQKLAENASGAYAIRDRDTHTVRYVGESSRGVLWKTLLRHFQAPDSFRSVRERGIFTGDPKKYDVAIHVTSYGARPRAPASGSAPSKRLSSLRKRGPVRTAPDQAALDKQAEWIASLRPTVNVDDGRAEGEETFLEARARMDREDEAAGAFGSLLNPGKGPRIVAANPSGVLTEIGKLTSLRVKVARTTDLLVWSLREAPSLAYDEKGRLAIVYVGRVVRAAKADETREYRRTHWGAQALAKVRNGGVAAPPFRDLGPAESITYTTRKGYDAHLVDYVHVFGEGARGKATLPRVLVHACAKRTCAGDGAIALGGGSYSVTSRGIVG